MPASVFLVCVFQLPLGAYSGDHCIQDTQSVLGDCTCIHVLHVGAYGAFLCRPVSVDNETPAQISALQEKVARLKVHVCT